MNENDISSIDLNLLKVFEAIYEEGSASRAALRLGVTQSAASAALSRLRTLYQDQLFERRGRGLVPTARAHELSATVREALRLCRSTMLSTAPGEPSYRDRTISLGLSDDLEIAMGRALADRLRITAPGLRLLLRQTNSYVATDALASRAVDLVLTAGGFASRAISHQTVMTGGYACILRTIPRHVRAELSLDDYLQRDHLLISSDGYAGIVDDALQTLGLHRHIEVSTTHFAAVPFLLGSENAIATLPTHAARVIARLAGFELMPCPLTLPTYAIELGWRPERLRDPAIRVVRDAVLHVFDPGSQI
ncbi:LysR family transcriptional regulator [Martelella alba]|uniref:LysR family transcriptional regulator n=1 Tax=Martelella alba TaxID=2590451 RepID=A0A506U2G1_9HYPH|nr:LysR family transcriptional regulator [Martelella alba]TPW26759.1 LysR family transcriptional regulator [Martelella alba]